ncbi:hypothetical protein [Oceanicoccus sp. KOV_DT_Chl]|uniref:hypothetical protein n=1 Tax=Oceanicoccus sp. KOV_DT_Chl TaxID=1904639 RepID=UPI0011AF740F|nr:hypothetical protein [Oceanicoccus sp. KOV_DT_Chl]
MKRTILKRRWEFKTSEQVNYSRINGYLSCMEVLNNGPGHLCLYELSPVALNGNRRESLIAHLNKITHLDISDNMCSWDWEVRLVKADNPVEKLSAVIDQFFFGQQHSPTLVDSKYKTHFLDVLMEEMNYVPIKFYEAISSTDETWHEIWWNDYLIDAGGELFHLHFGATN